MCSPTAAIKKYREVEGRIGVVGSVMAGFEEVGEMLEVAKEEKEEIEVKI